MWGKGVDSAQQYYIRGTTESPCLECLQDVGPVSAGAGELCGRCWSLIGACRCKLELTRLCYFVTVSWISCVTSRFWCGASVASGLLVLVAGCALLQPLARQNVDLFALTQPATIPLGIGTGLIFSAVHGHGEGCEGMKNALSTYIDEMQLGRSRNKHKGLLAAATHPS